MRNSAICLLNAL